MAYLSLYRRWRSQSFADVVGQTHIVQTLQNSLNSGRIAHAYLFTGPRGTGKTTIARLLAKGLNCVNGPTADFCGQCHECVGITNGNSLNVIEIDGASNRGIDEIRELREQVRFAPTDGRYRVYIIDEVHMLTTEAFNALLKTLEEPPARVVFILATTDPQKIPATILSRCQRYDFRRFSTEQICEHLRYVLSKEGVQAEQEALELVAEHAQGGMRDALGIIDQCMAYSDRISSQVVSEILGVAPRSRIVSFLQALDKQKLESVFKEINDLYMEGKNLHQFVKDIISFLRDLVLQTVNAADLNLSWSKADLVQMLEVFSQCERDMRYVSTTSIPLELAVLKLTQIPTTMSALQQKVNQLENQIAELAKARPVTAATATSAATDTTREAANEEPEFRLNVTRDDAANLKLIQDNWHRYLKSLHEERLVQQEAFLREGFPVQVEKNVLIIAFPKERGFHKASIEQEKHREPAERVLSKMLGKQFKIQCITGDPEQYKSNNPPEMSVSEETKSESEPEYDESVNAALRMFGGKIIEIRDK